MSQEDYRYEQRRSRSGGERIAGERAERTERRPAPRRKRRRRGLSILYALL